MLLPGNTKKQICTGAIFAVLAITTPGWASSKNAVNITRHVVQDTIPGKNKNKNQDRDDQKDLDQRIQQLENGLQQLEKQLQGKDFEKMEQKLEESLSKIDMVAIQQKFEQAMSKVDFDKIRLETNEAIRKIDLQKLQQQIRQAMEEAKNKPEFNKLQQELKESMKEVEKSLEKAKNIDYKKIERELAKNKEQWEKQKVNIEKELQAAKKELSNNKGTIQKALSEARDQIQATKETLQGYKKMIAGMEKDGLLNSKDDYTIDFKDGSLMINGKKQSQQVYDTYKSYFKKDNIHIKNEKGNFNVDDDSEN